ncbi:MAG: hotdog fold thioesterase [Proteobacteria bacterium]|nr:hotdog fold thioesterase [Pseudomonadota bacterium]
MVCLARPKQSFQHNIQPKNNDNMTSIWQQNLDLDKLNKHIVAGLSQALEIKIVARGKNWLMAEMPINTQHKQPFGIVHGGATAALAETVASVAAWLCVEVKTQTTVGLELNINHLRAVRDGKLFAKASAVHMGRLTQVWQIDIYSQAFKQVSAARLTVTVINH